MESRNITLALPDDLLRRIKVIAAKEDESVSSLLTRTLRQIVEQEEAYEESHRAMMKTVRKGFDLGTYGRIGWSRDSLHER